MTEFEETIIRHGGCVDCAALLVDVRPDEGESVDMACGGCGKRWRISGPDASKDDGGYGLTPQHMIGFVALS